MTDILRVLKDRNISIGNCPVTSSMLASMLKLIKDGTISGKIAKTVFEEMEKSGKNPDEIVKEKGLVQITDTSEIEKFVDEAITSSPENVAAYKEGKTKVLGWFVGQVMKVSKGKANPALVNKLLREKLG